MRLTRILPLILAGALQAMPLLRAVLPEAQAIAPSTWAIVLKLATGSVALLGYDAISSASSFNSIPSTATSGLPYSATCVYSGVNTPHSWAVNGVSCAPVQPFPGVTLAAAVSSVTTISGTPTQAGTFSFKLQVWSDSCSGFTLVSPTYTVTVVAGGTKPSITNSLVNPTVPVGSNVTFSVGAAGTAPLVYRRQSNNVTIAGATNSSLVLTNVQTASSATYGVIVTNALGAATNSAILTVLVPPSITVQPQSQISPAGGNVTFNAAGSGSAINYQWLFKGNALANDTASSLPLSGVTTDQSGAYALVVSNAIGSVTSSNAQLLVVPPPNSSMAPKLQPPPSPAPGQLSMAFDTLPGYAYQLQYTGTLGTTNWTTLSTIPPSFSTTNVTFLDAYTNAPQRFYRVKMSQ